MCWKVAVVMSELHFHRTKTSSISICCFGEKKSPSDSDVVADTSRSSLLVQSFPRDLRETKQFHLQNDRLTLARHLQDQNTSRGSRRRRSIQDATRTTRRRDTAGSRRKANRNWRPLTNEARDAWKNQSPRDKDTRDAPTSMVGS